jgi:hypothetical protein
MEYQRKYYILLPLNLPSVRFPGNPKQPRNLAGNWGQTNSNRFVSRNMSTGQFSSERRDFPKARRAQIGASGSVRRHSRENSVST